jgi:hypothetical protein
MKVTITATENFHPGCAECAQVIGLLVSAAVKDPSLTRLALKSGIKHCHPIEGPKPDTGPTLFSMPPRPTTANGFDYQGTHRGA